MEQLCDSRPIPQIDVEIAVYKAKIELMELTTEQWT
jgi:hypothetical protein